VIGVGLRLQPSKPKKATRSVSSTTLLLAVDTAAQSVPVVIMSVHERVAVANTQPMAALRDLKVRNNLVGRIARAVRPQLMQQQMLA
jgi:hypothetical protein